MTRDQKGILGRFQNFLKMSTAAEWIRQQRETLLSWISGFLSLGFHYRDKVPSREIFLLILDHLEELLLTFGVPELTCWNRTLEEGRVNSGCLWSVLRKALSCRVSLMDTRRFIHIRELHFPVNMSLPHWNTGIFYNSKDGMYLQENSEWESKQTMLYFDKKTTIITKTLKQLCRCHIPLVCWVPCPGLKRRVLATTSHSIPFCMSMTSSMCLLLEHKERSPTQWHHASWCTRAIWPLRALTVFTDGHDLMMHGTEQSSPLCQVLISSTITVFRQWVTCLYVTVAGRGFLPTSGIGGKERTTLWVSQAIGDTQRLFTL